ncbi:MAG: hypothetical protein II942_04040 [Alphaproteobacteria bacterium]|nr:hypothetical protein [Alphaproteobacteria bacterium]
MEKLFKFIHFMLSALINVMAAVGLVIVLLWLIWDVSPQQTITKTAYFFSESWALITGRQPDDSTKNLVTQQQLNDSAEHTHYLEK